MKYEVKRTDEEIKKIFDEVIETMKHKDPDYPGLSYKQGFKEGIEWVLGLRE